MTHRLISILFPAIVIIPSQTPSPAERERALHDPHHAVWSRPAPDAYGVKIETTKGDITLEVTRSLAPHGADRFYHLVQSGFYDKFALLPRDCGSFRAVRHRR